MKYFRNQKNQAGLDTVLAHMDWLHKICQEQEDVSCKFAWLILLLLVAGMIGTVVRSLASDHKFPVRSQPRFESLYDLFR